MMTTVTYNLHKLGKRLLKEKMLTLI